MPSDWKECTLGDAITLQRGFDLPIQDRVPGSVPVVSSSGITGTHFEAKMPGPGVVTGRYGTIGQVFYIKQDFWPLNTTLYVKDFKGNDALFISYLLSTVDFESCSDKSSVPGVNRNHLHMVRVSVPPLPEQHAIARILGTLDDKIELSRQMNKTLESIAQALFKSWFVDFDPVRARMEGHQPYGMDAETAALFPDSFEDSVLGEIPKGWRIGSVEDLGKIICGKTPPTSDPENYGDEIPFITIPDMHGKVFITETDRSLSFKGIQTQSNKTIPAYSICVSCIATPGIVTITSQPSQTNQQINSVIPNDKSTTFYCYWALKWLANEIKARGSGGSVTLNLNKGQFSALPVLLAPSKLMINYQKVAEPLFDRILSNEREISILTTLRDTLLPKLLSGEIRVKDAEKFVEASSLPESNRCSSA